VIFLLSCIDSGSSKSSDDMNFKLSTSSSSFTLNNNDRMDLTEIDSIVGILFRISKLLNVKYTARAVIERLQVNKMISKEGKENKEVVK
jgi:hypothetical protein